MRKSGSSEHAQTSSNETRIRVGGIFRAGRLRLRHRWSVGPCCDRGGITLLVAACNQFSECGELTLSAGRDQHRE